MRKITEKEIKGYETHLEREEKSRGTVEKYIRDIRAFAAWLEGRELCKELAAEWKSILQQKGLAPATVNSMLSALNGFFIFYGREDCRVKFLRIQRTLFRDPQRELGREEYGLLLQQAERKGDRRLGLLMETICATGIRVSEVRYITVEASKSGKAEISLKGKIRTILLPGKLCRKLLKYAHSQRIAMGEIFITKTGRGMSRRQIWAEMKKLCKEAGVEPKKVFPHNLRHLFARVFYKANRDIVKLADVLGHSSIETTRIYLISTGTEHIKWMERLGLVT